MAKINWTTEKEEKLRNLYLVENLSITVISKLLEYSKPTISKKLKELGITVINRQNQTNYDIIEDIIPLYNKGISLTKIAKLFNTSRDTLSKRLKNHNIEIVNIQNLTKFNENIFDEIDTEEKAYWLGFIYADGYISSNGNHFELSLQLSDINHLVKFNEFMQHNKNNIKFDSYRCRWSIANKHLWNTLNNYGCTPKKSLTLEFPNINIFKNELLLIDFIRGYFDGDGCISYKSTLRKRTYQDAEKLYAYCSIIGTKNFLNKIKDILQIDCKMYLNNKDSEFTYKLDFFKESSLLLLNKLFINATIYLDRKFELMKFFEKGCRSFKELKELLEGKIEETPEMENIEIND